ncbi:hypothetical protein ACP4OV_011878 [Aristida adscensionis]
MGLPILTTAPSLSGGLPRSALPSAHISTTLPPSSPASSPVGSRSPVSHCSSSGRRGHDDDDEPRPASHVGGDGQRSPRRSSSGLMRPPEADDDAAAWVSYDSKRAFLANAVTTLVVLACASLLAFAIYAVGRCLAIRRAAREAKTQQPPAT